TQVFDYLNYNDSANPAAHTYDLTAGQIVEAGFQPVTYDSNINTVDFAGSSAGGNQVNVHSAAPVNTGIGVYSADVVTVGSQAPALGGALAGLAQGGNLFIQSVAPNQSATVILDDSGDTQTGKQVSFDNSVNGWGVSGLAPERIYLSLGTGSNIQVLGSS